MTKLSLLVTSIFIFLAITMWYLANASFEEYIQERISKIGYEATELNVKVGSVRQLNNELIIDNIAFYNNNALPTLALSNIQLSINKDSLKEETIIIDTLVIERVIEHYKDEIQKKDLFNKLQKYNTNHLSIKKDNPQSMFVMKNLIIKSNNNIVMTNQERETTPQVIESAQNIILTPSIMQIPKNAETLFVEILALLIK